MSGGGGGDHSLQAEVRRLRGPRQLSVPDSYVRKHGVVTPGSVHGGGVRSEAYVFLRLDGKGAHFAGATQWRQMRILNEPDPSMWFFQMYLLMCESHWHGSCRPIADRVHDPQGYRLVVELQARVRADMATQADAALLAKLVRDDAYYDPHFEYDVLCEVYALQLRAAEELKAATEPAADGEMPKKRQKKKQAPVAMPPLIVMDRPLLIAAAAPQAPFPEAWNPIVDDDDVESLLHHYTEVEAKHLKDSIELARQPGLAVAAAADSDSERRIRERVAAEIRPPEPGTPPLVAKIEFNVCYVPSASGGGLMCRFLGRDPNMDLGKFLTGPLLKDIRQRIESKMQGNKGRGGAQKAKERFPHYRPLYYGSSHPVSDRTTMQTYFKMVVALCPEYLQKYQVRDDAFSNMCPDQRHNPTHPCNVLTLERALKTMIDVGCEARFCNGNVWRNAAGQPIAPVGLVTLRYMPDAVFWKNLYDVGLSEKYMPHVDADSDFMAAMVAGEDYARFLPGGEQLPRLPTQASRLYVENWRIPRSAVLRQDLLNYRTNNEHMHLAARAAIVNKRVAQAFPAHAMDTHARVIELGPVLWKQDEELMAKVLEYERYSTLLKLAQDGAFLSFEALWPLEGDVQEVPVSAPIQFILKWYIDGKPANLTREYVMWDRDLGFLGNSMLKSLEVFAYIGRIVHPSICLLSEGLFSCYRYAPRELALNIMAHGRFDVGKTFILITTLIKLQTIPGTVEEYTSETAAASTSENHVYDIIIASDEVSPWKVDPAEAKKNPMLVNQEKVKLVTQKVGKKIFTYVKTDEDEDVRWTRLITSDHYGALVEVTNWEIEEKNALSSRYLTLTVPLSSIPVRELRGDMPPSLTEGAKQYFHTNQYLSAGIYKAEQDGVIWDPNMKLFDDMNNRIMKYLEDRKAISQDAGQRGLEVMRPYAIQMVVHMAIHYAFDMPWSPNWKKQFEVKDLRAVQRYLYCTTEVVWWCWTSMACEWIEEGNARMLDAAMLKIDKKWLPGTSAYAMFERDLNDQIPFRVRPVPNFRGDKRDGDSVLIDLNYLAFEGSVDKVAGDIAGASGNRISKVQVLSAINYLKGRHDIVVRGGGMVPQPAAKFKRFHRYRVLPSNTVAGQKQRGVDDVINIPEDYLISNDNQGVDRTEADVPRYPESHTFTPVEISEDGKWVYIMPCVAEQFKARVILDALQWATVCKTMRAGKILLGTPSESDSMQLQTFECPREWISRTVVGLDAARGIINGQWKGGRAGEDPAAYVSRQKGFAFTRRGGISARDAIFVSQVPLASVSEENRDAYLERVKADVNGMSAVMEVIEDLDYHSARLQHLRCGLTMHEPVHDPKWIEQEFIRTAKPVNFGNINYPKDWKEHNDKKYRIWNTINDTTSEAAYFESQRNLNAPSPLPVMAPLAVVVVAPPAPVLPDPAAELSRHRKEKEKQRAKKKRTQRDQPIVVEPPNGF